MTETTNQDNQLRQMVSIKEVLEKVPFSKATLLRKAADGSFPKAKKIADGRIAWFLDEVIEWQKQLDNAA
ncbi:helix-turn-helix transcriptional regulator [Bradyrhizobium sp. SZCCHNS3053]|uniref:helix-turn-helix transcriptional regulator n=1 Tax=Bradyrhizobium sp. SZCCHNS3053 TaxID=3057322 RepID=UPI002915E85F|nr:AlpA family phage regulatory protein [Bradyrhizobium sp. SZCCHNS3053]